MDNSIRYTPNQQPETVPGLLRLAGLMVAVVLLMALAFMFYPDEMPGRGWRYVFLPPVAVILLMYAGARYIQNLYHLRRFEKALRYLVACLFGFGYPSLLLKEDPIEDEAPRPAGVKSEDEDGEDDEEDEPDELALEPKQNEHTLESIGGPGYIRVGHQMAALVEHYRNSFRVLGPGLYFISRFETVKEKAGLQEARRFIEKMTVMSQDGLEVIVEDINYRYRLCQSSENAENSFSEDAVIDRAYNRNASATGIMDWHDAVRSDVEGIITDTIRRTQMDYLVTPIGSEDARTVITSQFYSSEGRERVRKRGAYLTWIDIGVVTTPPGPMTEERVKAWVAGWEGRVSVAQAQGDDHRISTMDQGRLEVQKNMLQQIIRSFESHSLSGDTGPTLRKLYLMRLAQILDSVKEQRSSSRPMQEK